MAPAAGGSPPRPPDDQPEQEVPQARQKRSVSMDKDLDDISDAEFPPARGTTPTRTAPSTWDTVPIPGSPIAVDPPNERQDIPLSPASRPHDDDRSRTQTSMLRRPATTSPTRAQRQQVKFGKALEDAEPTSREVSRNKNVNLI